MVLTRTKAQELVNSLTNVCTSFILLSAEAELRGNREEARRRADNAFNCFTSIALLKAALCNIVLCIDIVEAEISGMVTEPRITVAKAEISGMFTEPANQVITLISGMFTEPQLVVASLEASGMFTELSGFVDLAVSGTFTDTGIT